MKNFNQLPEFQKEFKRLGTKYPSLSGDFIRFENIIKEFPAGIGKNFSIIHDSENVKVVKARLACKSLRDRSIRIVYAFNKNVIDFVYIEIYFKGDKGNEDRDRITQYLKTVV